MEALGSALASPILHTENQQMINGLVYMFFCWDNRVVLDFFIAERSVAVSGLENKINILGCHMAR